MSRAKYKIEITLSCLKGQSVLSKIFAQLENRISICIQLTPNLNLLLLLTWEGPICNQYALK